MRYNAMPVHYIFIFIFLVFLLPVDHIVPLYGFQFHMFLFPSLSPPPATPNCFTAPDPATLPP